MNDNSIELPNVVDGKVMNEGAKIVDLGARMDAMITGEGVGQLFEEMRAIAIGFMKRTDVVEQRLNYAIATVYVNLVRRKEEGCEWAPHMLAWLDDEIKELNNIRSQYLKDFEK